LGEEEVRDHTNEAAVAQRAELDEALNGPVVTVRSLETGEVVRQIPNETVVRIAHNIENIKGLLLNAKV